MEGQKIPNPNLLHSSKGTRNEPTLSNPFSKHSVINKQPPLFTPHKPHCTLLLSLSVTQLQMTQLPFFSPFYYFQNRCFPCIVGWNLWNPQEFEHSMEFESGMWAFHEQELVGVSFSFISSFPFKALIWFSLLVVEVLMRNSISLLGFFCFSSIHSFLSIFFPCSLFHLFLVADCVFSLVWEIDTRG